MIVDTHVHVWEIDPPRYPIGPTAPRWTAIPDEPATAELLIEEMDIHGVDWSVVVQTSWSTWDNGYIADSVAKYPNRFVGLGLVDPLDPKNAATARYWMQERGLLGFRFHTMYYPDEKVLLREENVPLWEEFVALDAIVQLHLRVNDADQAAEIARRYPQLRIVIDHMGYPDVEQPISAFDPVLALAQYDNVYMRLSDIARRSKQPYPHQDLYPFFQGLVDAFSPQRCMWGTGFAGYHRAKHGWPTLDEELRQIREGFPFLSQEDIDAILGKTAVQFYRLPV